MEVVNIQSDFDVGPILISNLTDNNISLILALLNQLTKEVR